MPAAILLELLTPERRILETRVESVVVPALEGELGILSGHAPLLAQLQEGEIRSTVEGKTEHFAVSGGFVHVHDNKVTVFAETAEMASDIDLERARQAAERAKAALQALPSGDLDLRKAEASLRRALARLRVAEYARRPR